MKKGRCKNASIRSAPRGQRCYNDLINIICAHINFIRIYTFNEKFTKNTCFYANNMVKYTIENNL